MGDGYLRIGEFSQRVGVSPERLRAWEKRYGLLEPDRSDGGFRLYSDADVARVDRMLGHLERGASAAEAARLAWETPPADAPPPLPESLPLAGDVERLRAPLERFDEAGAHGVLDRLFATYAVETVLRDVIVPYLVDLGARWASGDVSVAQEHFASNLLRARLLGLAQGWGQGVGPKVVLAAPPGEQHDLGLVICGLALSRQGPRVVFLGADCPIDTLITTARAVRPVLMVLSAVVPGPFDAAREPLRELGAQVPLYLAAAGASQRLADDLGATYVEGDPVTAGIRLAHEAATAS